MSLLAQASPPAALSDPAWIGAQACADCHQAEYKAWQGSHHDLAMQPVTSEAVLGNFDNARFNYNGIESRFFQRDGEFWAETDGPDGKLAEYKIEYLFGVHPLQQYLVSIPGGRLHALSIAWDSRPAAAGGQRWFHLYPEEVISAGDPLHWTGPYQNWNLQCAECHSTNLQKNFDPQTSTYATTWSEVNVACEACHGPGRQHQVLAEAGKLQEASNSGFPVALAERGGWAFKAQHPNARRTTPLPDSQQVENCGRCHARRGTLGSYLYGRDLLDTHRPALLEAPLYHADGQILDEVYVYGSFLQSKMAQAGVVCSNCHDPHSNELRAPGNAVCSQCHKPAVYDTSAHHHHPEQSSGAECANCHMPSNTYMVVDPRRDHSMRVPRPDLSVVLDTPNACNQCHSERDAEWALDSLRKWGVKFSDTGSHPARSLSWARQADGRAVPGLQQIALDPGQASILRATAMTELGSFNNREAYETALQLLQSSDPMLRWSAVRALQFIPIQQRFGILGRHLEDPSSTVRMEIARVLAEVPLQQMDPGVARQLQALFDEYLNTLGQHADMPATQLQMAQFFTARQFWGPAEQAYRNALAMNSQLLAAYLNLADLYRLQNREAEARQVLLQATAALPGQGVSWHSLGLLETRAGNREQALEYLLQAADLETSGVRHRYVYAIALHDAGQPEAAIKVLQALLRDTPENPDILVALVTYCESVGRREDARHYVAKLKALLPEDPGIQQLYESLQN
ncbi:MAG: HEAT repeat domain-containing protein [Halieaceae bacterium]